MPAAVSPAPLPPPKLKAWMAAVEHADTTTLRAWVQAGHAPPDDAWHAAARGTWGQPGQRCFQALCAGKGPVPLTVLEHATAHAGAWGRQAFARLIPRALAGTRWAGWLGQAWMASLSPSFRLLPPRWSSDDVLDWLAWGVDKGWMSSEEAVEWCAKQSQGQLSMVGRSGVAGNTRALALLATGIRRHGGLATPELKNQALILFRAACQGPRPANDPFGARVPVWFGDSIRWWGEFVPTVLPDSGFREAVCSSGDRLEAALLEPNFAPARRALPRDLALGLGQRPASWWATFGPRIWASPGGEEVARAWEALLGQGQPRVNLATLEVLLEQHAALGVTVSASAWRTAFREAVGAPFADAALAHRVLTLPARLGWCRDEARKGFEDLLIRAGVQAQPGAARLGPAVDDWARQGIRVTVPAAPEPGATPGFVRWLAARRLDTAWEPAPSAPRRPRL